MSVYQPGIPTGLVDLNVDYQAIQGNFTQANVVFDVDHVPFDNTTAQKGYHEDIHFNPVSTTTTNMPNNYLNNYPQGIPSTVLGIGQLFGAEVTDGSGTDTGLYFLSGGGLKTALTRNFQPTNSASGRTFLPGGLVLQWGTFNIIATTGLVFTWPFPFTTLYSATLGAINGSLGGDRVANFLNTPTAAGGTVYVKTDNNSPATGNVFFMAIGV